MQEKGRFVFCLCRRRHSSDGFRGVAQGFVLPFSALPDVISRGGLCARAGAGVPGTASRSGREDICVSDRMRRPERCCGAASVCRPGCVSRMRRPGCCGAVCRPGCGRRMRRPGCCVAVCRPGCGRRMCLPDVASRCVVPGVAGGCTFPMLRRGVGMCVRIGVRGQLPALFCSFSASSWARDLDLVTSQTPAKTQRAAAPLVNPNVSSPMATVKSTATTGWT